MSPTTTKCECMENFIKVNGSCIDFDECQSDNICDKNAQCKNLPGSHVCACLPGFHGNGTFCEVGSCSDDICPTYEECVSPTRTDCECKKGFKRDLYSRCIDEDECSTSNKCDMNAKCENSVGSFTCSCNSGFYGSGELCSPGRCIDASCPINQKCKSRTSTCHCPENFSLVDGNCTDIDECFLESHSCPYLSTCVNENGGYKCACFSGYGGNSCTNTVRLSSRFSVRLEYYPRNRSKLSRDKYMTFYSV